MNSVSPISLKKMVKSTVWIVIPAYNEAKNIGNVLDTLQGMLRSEGKRREFKVLVVDDGSRDATSDICKARGVKVLRHALNLGKGSALRSGCDYAAQMGADIIVVMDADGQHDPTKIPTFLSALAGKDIVFGYRSYWGRMPFVLRFGNWFINNSVAILFGARIRDTQSGFRAFRSDVYAKIRWEATDYFMESEMIAHVGKHKLRFAQIPIPTIYTDKYKGTTVFDGIKIVGKMLVHRFAA